MVAIGGCYIGMLCRAELMAAEVDVLRGQLADYNTVLYYYTCTIINVCLDCILLYS